VYTITVVRVPNFWCTVSVCGCVLCDCGLGLAWCAITWSVPMAEACDCHASLVRMMIMVESCSGSGGIMQSLDHAGEFGRDGVEPACDGIIGTGVRPWHLLFGWCWIHWLRRLCEWYEEYVNAGPNVDEPNWSTGVLHQPFTEIVCANGTKSVAICEFNLRKVVSGMQSISTIILDWPMLMSQPLANNIPTNHQPN